MTTQCDQIILHGPVLEHYNNAGRACVKHSKKRREGSVGATCKKLAPGALQVWSRWVSQVFSMCVRHLSITTYRRLRCRDGSRSHRSDLEKILL